mmetsp:Transcript_21874/g.64568  ORF Transcript_21874/g.64568 Transcript_21874/m.64568 type:complete len:369 (-) Transcript_21874:750-1856(-)
MNTSEKPQPRSAERIREGFLSTIGIDAPLPPPPSRLNTVPEDGKAEAADGGGGAGAAAATEAGVALAPAPPLSPCLDGVRPLYEPLKVCLDDDTSDEDDGDDFGDDDDDDYFVGIGEEDIEGLFKKRCICVPHHQGLPTSAPTVSAPFLKAPAQQPAEAPSMTVATPFGAEASTATAADAAAAAAVSDEGSALSEASSSTRTSSSSLHAIALSRSSASHDSLSSKSAQGTKRKRSRRRVSLKADVAVVPIPRREEYSDCTRERLWSSATELYQNAARNAVEFASEGWNWRNVTEDEDMLVHDVSGELIHPVHLKNVLQMNAESQEPPLRIPLRPNRPGASLSDLTGKGQVHVASTSIQPQQPPNLSPA